MGSTILTIIFSRSSDDVDALADALQDTKIEDKGKVERRRNPMGIYCVAEVRQTGKRPRKCGAKVRIGASTCDKDKWPHRTCWDNVSCSHCGNYINLDEPWSLVKCPACEERLHGGEMNGESLGLH